MSSDNNRSELRANGRLDIGVESLQERALTTQLSAVALLAARTDRDVAHYDILLATAFEILAPAPLTLTEIEAGVKAAWPQLNLPPDALQTALTVAIEIDHVALRGSRYELLDQGLLHVQQTAHNASKTVEEFVGAIRDELVARRVALLPSEGEALASTVIAALRDVVAGAFRSDGGSTEVDGDGNFRVVDAGTSSLDAWLDARITDGSRRSLVRDLVLSSLDRSTSLGNDLVHDLVVGHILYAFMARPDLAEAMGVAGPIAGERIILDTPVLVRLVSHGEPAVAMRSLLARAVQLGVEIVLYERTVEEFARVLQRAGESAGVHEIEAALEAGADPLVLATLQRVYELNWCWLHWASDQPVGRRTWTEWRHSTNGDEAALGLLKALGIEPQPGSPFDGDFAASARCVDFESRLHEQLRAAGRQRSPEVIRHDALNLTEVWRIRESTPETPDRAWPGAFILSPDGQINQTYDEAIGSGPFPAAIGFSQCAAIIGRYMSAREGERFAQEIAPGVTEQLLLSKAGAVDARTARRLAEALRADSVSAEDVYQLRFDYEAALEQWRGANQDEDLSDSTLRVGVIDHLRSRKQALEEQRRTRADNAQRQHELSNAAAAAALKAEQAHSEQLRTERDEAIARAQTAGATSRRLERAAPRSIIVGIVIGATAIVAVGAAVLEHWITSVFVALLGFAAWATSEEWVDGERSARFWLASLGVVAVTLGQWLFDW